MDAAAIGDFNKDGILDVLIHGFNTSTEANEYYVLPGKAGATFDLNNPVITPDGTGNHLRVQQPDPGGRRR